MWGVLSNLGFQPEGTLTDIYTEHPKTFGAPTKSFVMNGYAVPGAGNARRRKSPFRPVYLFCLILYLDPDCRTALVGYPGRLPGVRPLADDRRRALSLPSSTA